MELSMLWELMRGLREREGRKRTEGNEGKGEGGMVENKKACEEKEERLMR